MSEMRDDFMDDLRFAHQVADLVVKSPRPGSLATVVMHIMLAIMFTEKGEGAMRITANEAMDKISAPVDLGAIQ